MSSATKIQVICTREQYEQIMKHDGNGWEKYSNLGNFFDRKGIVPMHIALMRVNPPAFENRIDS